MYVFTPSSVRRRLTPWGEEVKRRLRAAGMTQDDLCRSLLVRGQNVGKVQLSMMLYGGMVTTHMDAVHDINDILGIPEQAEG